MGLFDDWRKKVGGFFKNPLGTARDEVVRAFVKVFGEERALLALPGGQIIWAYIKLLDVRAKGRWQQLPGALQSTLASEYPNINLADVIFADGVDTVHGQAITIGNRIYFPGQINLLENASDFHWMLHELEHVSQYQKHGGVAPFMIKYLVNGALQILSNRSINIHDEISLEREASDKADRIFETAAQNVQSYAIQGFRERFRVTNSYAGRHGFGAGFPNFHVARYSRGLVFGVMLIKPEYVEAKDVLASDLGNPEDERALFRAVDAYAGKHGFGGALPNFHQANYGQGTVYGVHFIKAEVIKSRDVLMSELGDPSGKAAIFRAVNAYAGRHGFGAGFPNFHQASYDRGAVYGVKLISSEAIVSEDVLVSDLAIDVLPDVRPRLVSHL